MCHFHHNNRADKQHHYPLTANAILGKQKPKLAGLSLTKCSKNIIPGNSHNAAIINEIPTSLLPPPIEAKNLCQEAIDHCVKAEQKAESYE